jgi:hypothetical protein
LGPDPVNNWRARGFDPAPVADAAPAWGQRESGLGRSRFRQWNTVLVRNPQFLWKTPSWLLPGLLFYYVQICTGKGPHYVAPFDSERAAGQRHRLAHALAPIGRPTWRPQRPDSPAGFLESCGPHSAERGFTCPAGSRSVRRSGSRRTARRRSQRR